MVCDGGKWWEHLVGAGGGGRWWEQVQAPHPEDTAQLSNLLQLLFRRQFSAVQVTQQAATACRRTWSSGSWERIENASVRPGCSLR